MQPHLISKQEVSFAAPYENTFGLGIRREVWETGTGEKIFYRYVLPDVTQIFAVTTDGKLITISEFQPGVSGNYSHLPGETLEKGESSLEAARRGLLEETGFAAQSVMLLSSILQDTSRSDRLIHVVLAQGCKKVQQGEKEIKVALVDPMIFWDDLMQYFLENPEGKHGGGNTLKTATLALHKLVLLP